MAVVEEVALHLEEDLEEIGVDDGEGGLAVGDGEGGEPAEDEVSVSVRCRWRWRGRGRRWDGGVVESDVCSERVHQLLIDRKSVV